MASDDKVNILLVDDQPAKLLSYETILAELGENLIKAASAREALEQLLKQEIAVILVDVCMPELDGFQLAAMIREHPRFQTHRHHFHFRHPSDRRGPPARLRDGRGRLRSGAGHSGGAAGQGQDFRGALSQDQTARAAKSGARASRRRANRRTGGLDRAADAERRSPQPGAGRRSDGLVGMGPGQRRLRLGRRAVPDFRRRPRDVRRDRRQYQGVDSPRGLEASAERDQAGVAEHAEFPDRVSRLSSQWGDALVHRNRGGERRRDRQHRAHQRRDRRHHRPQGSRGAPGAAGARGRSPREKRPGIGAVDRAADAVGHHQVLYRRRGRAHRGTLARAHAARPEPLAGRRPRAPGGGRACAVSRGR